MHFVGMRASLGIAVLVLVVVSIGSIAAGGAGQPVQADDTSVRVVAAYSVDGDLERETVLVESDFASVGPIEQRRGKYVVPARLENESARKFADRMVELGFTSEGIDNCPPDLGEADGYCLQPVVDGEVVYNASLSGELALELEDGTFVEDPQFQFVIENRSRAEELRAGLAQSPSVDVTTTTTTERGAEESLPTPGFTAGLAMLAVSLALVARRRRRQ
jgi:hypothetical protein